MCLLSVTASRKSTFRYTIIGHTAAIDRFCKSASDAMLSFIKVVGGIKAITTG